MAHLQRLLPHWRILVVFRNISLIDTTITITSIVLFILIKTLRVWYWRGKKYNNNDNYFFTLDVYLQYYDVVYSSCRHLEIQFNFVMFFFFHPPSVNICEFITLSSIKMTLWIHLFALLNTNNIILYLFHHKYAILHLIY